MAATGLPAHAQTVVVEWNFPTNSANAVADGGTSANTNREISTGGNVGAVTYAAGASSQAARAASWVGGVTSKYWMVEFSSFGFQSLTLSSKQRSSPTGPKNYKLQYRAGAVEWEDVSGGTVACADNWTGGVIANLSLPTACDNQALVGIRWLMADNISVTNDVVVYTGANLIDDIVVQGVRQPPNAPQAQRATEVSAAGFTANWLPVADVSGYQLDVATNANFATESPKNLMTNSGFELGDSTGWSTFEPGYSVVSELPYSGDYCIKCTATATRSIAQNVMIPPADGSTTYEISYWYRVTDGDGTDVRIWAKWDNGLGVGDYLQPTTYNLSSNQWTQMVYTNTPPVLATNFNFEVRVYSNATVYLDDFVLRTHGPYRPGDFLPGYESRTIAGTSESVSGLEDKRWYYYRVRAVDGGVVGMHSDIISVRASDTGPGHLFIVQ